MVLFGTPSANSSGHWAGGCCALTGWQDPHLIPDAEFPLPDEDGHDFTLSTARLSWD